MDERQSTAPPNGNEPVSEKGIIAQLALPRCVFFAFSGPETRLGRNPIPGVGLKARAGGTFGRSYYKACAVQRRPNRSGKLGRVAGHSREGPSPPAVPKNLNLSAKEFK